MAGTVEVLLLRPSEHEQAPLPSVPLEAGTGLAVLPLTEEITAGLLGPAESSGIVDGFYNLSDGIATWARERSADGVVAYVHTEFFGGGGFHAAVAWRDGSVVWGPVFTATSAGEAEAHYTVAADRHDMAVNVLLRWWGVRRGEAIDEYAAAGFDRCRWTDDWAALLRS